MRHISRLQRITWYGTVLLLVLLALLVTAIRLSIGSATEYRGKLEEMAGQYLGQPVTIQSMDARLLGVKPTILLQDVAFREKGSGEQLAQFEEIGIALNPFASLRHLQPIIELTIRGANIVLIQRKDGSFRLQGVSLSQQAKDVETGGALGAWFLSQARLALESSRIIWRNEKNGRDVTFEHVAVELQNVSERHRLNAFLQMPEDMGEHIRLALDIRGNLLNQKDWRGELYLKAAKLKPSVWVKDLDYRGIRFTNGNVDLVMWSHWQDGMLKGVEGEFNLTELAVQQDKSTLPISRVACQWQYNDGADGWQMLVQNAVLGSGTEQSKPFRFQLQNLDGVASIRAKTVDIERLMDFSTHFPGLSRDLRQQLLDMNPSGWIDTLRVDMRGNELLGAVAVLKDFSNSAWKQIPGLQGLTAELGFDGHNGSIKLDTTKLQLDLPELFDHPLPLQETHGLVQISKQGKGWRIEADDLQIRNPDLVMDLGLSLQLQPGSSPLLSLLGSFHDGNITSIPTYLPVKIMPKAGVNWLQRAFKQGRISEGMVLVHGLMDKTLMQEKQGRFEVRLATQDVELDYLKGWPVITGINSDVRFIGNGMQINIHDGRMYQSKLNTTKVRIRNFSRSLLEIDGSVQASAPNTLQFLREAPFTEGIDLSGFKIDGNSPLKLSMLIPLSEAVSQQQPFSLNGEMELQGNWIYLAKGVEANDARGTVKFTEKTYTSNNLTATMFGFPVTATMFTEETMGKQYGDTIVAARGHAEAATVRKALNIPLLEVASGETDWQSRVRLTPGKEGAVMLSLYSDLNGVAVSLPPPMNKDAIAQRDMNFSLGLAGKQQGVYRVKYGDLVNTTWRYSKDGKHLKRLAAVLGDAEVRLPETDMLSVSGSATAVNWKEWYKVWERYFPPKKGDRVLPMQVHMQKLHVLKPADEKDSGKPLQSLPPMDVKIADFIYDDALLGEFSFRAVPVSRRVLFKDIRANGRDFNIEANGSWYIGGESNFDVKLKSSNMGNMLRDLGFATVISGGKATSNGKVEWQGSPVDFALKKVVSKGSVHIEEGVVKQIDPGAGKLLGLLSLEALPRRLFLDFSDMAKDGMEFSTIKASFQINNGNAFTDNLVLKASVAEIMVTGRTGLVARDFDQLVTVIPNVSDTVSVAGALAWGPEVAAALILLQRLFKSGIDQATMVRYQVGGTWEKPVITRLDEEPVQTVGAQEID